MEQLRRLREARGLSQTKLAARADVNPATVNQIEGGKRAASPATLNKLAAALDVSLYELLEGEARPKAQAPLPLEESERGADWKTDVLERVLGTWERQVREKENPYQSRTVAVAALDIQDAVTFNYKPEWDALPYEEKMERHALAKRIDALVLDAFDHFKEAKKAEAAEVEAIQRRRDEIRQRTRELSA